MSLNNLGNPMNKIIAFVCVFLCQIALAKEGYYRFPALNADNVVFTAEGDLWLYSIKNNASKRITTQAAEEKHAKISLDGKWIAFSANYEGATEVYVISIKGGIAKRVTFENSSIRLQSWLSDGTILYATNSRVGPTGNWTLKTVNPNDYTTQFIPLADAVEGSIDEKSDTIFFTQFGLQLSSDNAKIYRGGAEGELWSFNLKAKKEAKLLTENHVGDARQPMYFNNTLYFISDASGADNIWQMDVDGSNIKQLTQYSEWPIRSAQLNEANIIFQQGADLKVFNIPSKKVKKLTIELVTDSPSLREKWDNKPLNRLTSAHLSSSDKVVITSRGRVAVAGKDKSRLVEISTPVSSRTRSAILSKDGNHVYAINDSSGELEIWQFAADGSEKAKQLTNDGSVFRWNLVLSPDGKMIAHDDKLGNLWLLTLASGKNKKLLKNNAGMSPFQDVVWSSDSKYIALTRERHEDERSRVMIYSVNDNKHKLLTTDKYNSYSPTFSTDGNWLYFLSDRHFSATPGSPWGDRNMGALLDRRALIYAYALCEGAKFPFQNNNELLALEKANKEKSESDKKNTDKDNIKEETKDKTDIHLDWDSLGNKLWQVPIISGNYYRLAASEKYLYLLNRVSEPESKTTLNVIEIKAKSKIASILSDVGSFELSADKSQLFVRKSKSNEMFITKANGKFPKKTVDEKVQTSTWQLAIQPIEEWKQIFHDAWLMHRDSLYDKNMRGVNWQKVRSKYQPLLSRLTDRHELNDIFKQMMGELNSLHSQVRGGDTPKDTNAAKVATLGAQLKQSKSGVVIEHIYQTDKELPHFSSPLNSVESNVKEGDIIERINGHKVVNIAEVNAMLRNKAGKQVLIDLSRNKITHKTIVVPISTRKDANLRYQDWVIANQNKVTKTNGNLGYLHLYAMGGRDVASFAREFYANYKKGGLIIDVRRNRGGNIDSWIIEKLLRRAWMFWQPPIGAPSTNMQQTFRGHLVVLADQMTYSDGETFTAAIIANKLAPVIGKQTAGAGVWLSGRNRQSDGGMARVAEYPVYSMDGRWIVEGHGVKPTMEVDNLPHATFKGKDAQLEAAIVYLNDKLIKQAIPKLKAQPFPSVNKPAADILK